MKYCIRSMSLVFLVAICLACSSSPDKTNGSQSPTQRPLSCPFKSDGIQLILLSDPQLHFTNNMPHSLFMCVYQLREPNAFKLKTKYEDGLYELLDCTGFDASVNDFEKVVVYPDQNETVTMDREIDTNYIGLVAGYNNMQKERIIRLREIPVEAKTKLLTPWKKYYVCSDVKLEVTLGPEEIEKIEVVE